MSQLTPNISRSLSSILNKSGVEWRRMDEEDVICCGRPLILSGRRDEAAKLIEKNRDIILSSGAEILLVSCPICYKVFKEEYDLPGIRVIHHSEYLLELANSGAITLNKGEERVVYHDPCELGRGCGVYEAPRALLNRVSNVVAAAHEKDEALCCGGSIGSITLSGEDRVAITDAAIQDLTINSPNTIVTACPLCLKTFSPRTTHTDIKIKDIAEIVEKAIL